MTSLFAQLYLAIQDRIKTVVPDVKWIDQDLGQLEQYEVRPSVAFPCVLIDFGAAQYTDQSDDVQWVNVQIALRLGFAPFGSANGVSPQATKEHALEYYEIEQKLYEALQNFTANGCVQPMTRISATTEMREDTFRVRQLVFTTATEDDTARPVTTKVAAAMEVENKVLQSPH